jgi:hypothetical protein
MACERLDGGRLTAIDRSPKMVEAAARRNAAFVEQGKAEFLVAELEDLDLGESSTASPREHALWSSRGSPPAGGCAPSSSAKTAPITNAFAALRNGRRTSPCRAPGRYALRGHARRGPFRRDSEQQESPRWRRRGEIDTEG